MPRSGIAMALGHPSVPGTAPGEWPLLVLVLSLSKRDLLHRKLCRTMEIPILPCRWHLGSNGRIYAAAP